MSNDSLENQVQQLNTNIETLSKTIQKLRLGDYVEALNRPMKIFYSNFMWGLSRGLGMAVGFSVLGAVLLYILKSLVSLPWIGNIVTEIVKIVQNNLQ